METHVLRQLIGYLPGAGRTEEDKRSGLIRGVAGGEHSGWNTD